MPPEGYTDAYDCPPKDIVYDAVRGAKICKKTGQVIEESVITEDAEWRAYTPEERQRRTRTGAPLTPAEVNYGADPNLVKRPGAKMGSLGRVIRRSPGAGGPLGMDRTFKQATDIIDDIVASLGLPNEVKEEAANIYRQALSRGLTRGRSVVVMAAAAVFAACRKHNVACTLDDIAKRTETRDGDAKREIGRCYRMLVRDLPIRPQVVKPELYVSRIVSSLIKEGTVRSEVKERIQTLANRILEMAKKYGLTAGKDPSGLAAAAVYMAAQSLGVKKTQKEVASVAGVTEVTVRNRYKELSKISEITELLEYYGRERRGGIPT